MSKLSRHPVRFPICFLVVVTISVVHMPGPLDGVAAQSSTSATAPCLATAHVVCGRDKKGNKRTYGNECVARRSGVVTFTEGACKSAEKGRYR